MTSTLDTLCEGPCDTSCAPLLQYGAIFFLQHKSKYDMRDCLFGSALQKGEGSSVLKYITEQLPDVKEIKLMGEFETFEECFRSVEKDLLDGKLPCLITGSLNYIPTERWREANDIDVMLFTLGNKYTSSLKENDDIDVTTVSVSADDIENNLKTSLYVVYPVSRYFYKLWKRDNYLDLVEKITALKEECSKFRFKSSKRFKGSIVPAFKGFVIATIAIETEGGVSECLKGLALLNSLQFDENGDGVVLNYYPEGFHVSQMIQHQLIVPPAGKIKRLGNASVRRGITKLISQEPLDYTQLVKLTDTWYKEIYGIPFHLSNDGDWMSYIMAILNNLYSDSTVFTIVNDDRNQFQIRVDPTGPLPQPQPSRTPEETVSFWALTRTPIQEASAKSESMSMEQRPPVRDLVEDGVTGDVESFLRAMIKRDRDCELPMISRHVEDEEKWESPGLCLCHTNGNLPTPLTFNGMREKITLEKRNEEAYNSLMRSWFGEPYPSFEEGYTRFTNLIKLLDSLSRESDRRMDWYTFAGGYTIQPKSFNMTPIKPSGSEWSLKKFRAGWKQIREDMDKTERSAASLATELEKGANVSSPDEKRSDTTPDAPRRAHPSQSRFGVSSSSQSDAR